MDFLKEYNKHQSYLKEHINLQSERQKKEIVVALIHFCFILPSFKGLVKEHIGREVQLDRFLDDFEAQNLDEYTVASAKALGDEDPYADDFKEWDPLDLLVLNMFDYLLIEDRTQCVLRILNGVIELLDYYHQFSDRPQYWSHLLQTELLRQKEILKSEKVRYDLYTKVYSSEMFQIG
ncbi:hypothetical protein [Sediminicola luteus]|uniref:Uncharacterized protein n=1 Tax=Sediminicola luteus TaxID=319238 RepID=A0A2A4G0L0_9FLAO|nr:hypothetical protein [Sediminicola luteus]PCE62529.1 hypothetical protein B7P33_17995 [Sediminicola luteus]